MSEMYAQQVTNLALLDIEPEADIFVLVPLVNLTKSAVLDTISL